MNERIKELWTQAEQRQVDDNGGVWVKTIFETRDKFAQLIVRECVEQIVARGTDWVDFAPSQTGVRPEYWNMAQQIRKHFGVEE